MNSKKNSLLSKDNSAFTLTEVLTATVIMILALGGILSVYIMVSNLGDIEIIRTKELNEGSLIMEKIIRGVNSNDGLREAVSFTITSPSDITYTIIGGASRRFYLNSNKIYYGPSNVIIGDDVSALTFTGTANYVDINITFSKTHRGKTYSFKLFGSVQSRN